MPAANGTPTMGNLSTEEHRVASNKKMANLAKAAEAREKSASPFNWSVTNAPKPTNAFKSMGPMKYENNTLRKNGQRTPEQEVTTVARYEPGMAGTKLFGGRRRRRTAQKKSTRSRRSQRKTQRR